MNIIQPEGNYLIKLLSAIVHDEQPPKTLDNIDWEKLYKLSAFHSISNMVSYSIEKLNNADKPPKEIILKFQNDCKKGIAKEAVQHITVEQIIKNFEENNITCLPLKGYLIKNLYPQHDMRMMADIDILIKDEQSEQVKNLMIKMGFTVEHEGGNHDVYYKKPYMNLEMHRRLMPENSPYSDYFSKVWERAIQKPGYNSLFELCKEDFFVYMVTHITKHYANSGTGIRSIMDIWLFNNHHANQMDWKYIQAELESLKLWEFTRNICGLSETWFGNEKSNKLYDEMSEFILSSGVYGTRKYSLTSSMSKKANYYKNHSNVKLIYWIKLFFPELNHMKILYPVLGTMPFLLPFCWVIRGVKSLLFKRKYTFLIINNIHLVSKEDVTRLYRFHKKSGLIK